MNIPYVMRKCSACGEWKVASTVNFSRHKTSKYGLQSKCKKCRNKESKQYRKDNKEKISEQRKQYYQNNKEKVAERCKQYYKANKEKVLEQHKQWCKNNKEKISEQKKQYYQDNKEKIKQYREDNKDKKHEYDKQYYQSPQGQAVAFNKHQKRRAKEEKQGSGITKDQWLELMSFFNWKCAYSGETLIKDNRSIDHIVPLNSNGDNMIWNCVPMLRSLNSSKQDKDMLEWYKEQDFYSEARLAKIYKWQEYARKKWEN